MFFVVFVRFVLAAGVHFQVVERQVGETAIGRELLNFIINAAAIASVSVPFFDQDFDEPDHFGDIIGRSRIVFDALDAQILQIFEKCDPVRLRIGFERNMFR